MIEFKNIRLKCIFQSKIRNSRMRPQWASMNTKRCRKQLLDSLRSDQELRPHPFSPFSFPHKSWAKLPLNIICFYRLKTCPNTIAIHICDHLSVVLQFRKAPIFSWERSHDICMRLSDNIITQCNIHVLLIKLSCIIVITDSWWTGACSWRTTQLQTPGAVQTTHR